MKKLLILTISIFIVAQYFFILPVVQPVRAADYSLDYDIHYSLEEDGSTQVDYHIKLHNLTHSLYADSHNLIISQTDIYNLKVKSSQGTNETSEIKKADKTTTITTKFNNPAIGQGSFNDWHIIYNTKQIAKEDGHVWTVLIPGFSDKKELNINDLQIVLSVPNKFASINFANPTPSETKTGSSRTEYVFNSNKIEVSGISLILGKAQTYSFSFNYPIKNITSTIQSYTFAIPFDSDTQQISFNNVSPTPSSFSINNEGDYILTYKIDPQQEEIIKVEGIASIESQFGLLNNPLKSKIALSVDDVNHYTAEERYWEVNDSEIKNTATKITKGISSNIDKERAIYDYLVKNFKYNQNALYDKNRSRKGALYSLNNPTDVICQEYVDTFVALSRSIGIPSRFIAGFGNTISPYNLLPQNTLHAWAEFFDPSFGWIPVDPTWGSTSGQNFFGNLGSDHFALTIYGSSSTEPALVSSFTATKTKDTADSSVVFKSTNDDFKDNINFDPNDGKQVDVNGGFLNNGEFNIKNIGNRVLYLKSASLAFNNLNIDTNNTLSTVQIFPSMSGVLKFPITTGSIITSENYSGIISGEYKTYNNVNKAKKIDVAVNITPARIFIIIPVLAVILIFMLSYFIVTLTAKIYRQINKNKLS